MKRQWAKPVCSLPNQHMGSVYGAQVRRPDQLLQQLTKNRVGNLRNPFVIGKPITKLANFMLQAIAAIRIAPSNVALVQLLRPDLDSADSPELYGFEFDVTSRRNCGGANA